MSGPVTVNLKDNIALVSVDNPPVNAAAHAVRVGLLDAIIETEANGDVEAVILLCQGRTFIAGADIKEFNQPAQDPVLPDLIHKLESTAKPWIAAIHGSALGGGLEIALGCNFRIAHSASKLGFPEVNLGLIPGAGGTVRLPRCIGMKHALEMICYGKPVKADQALANGLIDEVFEGDVLDAALNFVHKIISDTPPTPLIKRDYIKPMDDTELETLRGQIDNKMRGQIAPPTALDLIAKGAQQEPKDQLYAERESFLELKSGSQSAALRYIFSAERSATKFNASPNIKTRPLNRIGVVGGGTMGTGIVSAILLAGFNAMLIEQNRGAANRAKDTVVKTLEASAARGIISQEHYNQLIEKLYCTDQYEALSDADLVIEAVFEDMNIKKFVFEKLDQVVRGDAILATNTSYLDVNEIAEQTIDPSRMIGLHFFSPAHIMKLVEVIQTKNAGQDVLATAFAFVKKMRKLPVLSGVCDGFIGNRIMSTYRKQAEYLLEDGSLPFEIDEAMKNFGFPMGIFEMQDMAGLDIGYAMRQRKASTRSPDERYVHIADKIVEMGRLGRKSGGGFYDYSDRSSPTRSDEIERLIRSESDRKNIKRHHKTDDEIMNMLLGSMVNEGHKILDEHIAHSPQTIDVVMINGFGFPRYRGGPMFVSMN